MINTERLNDSYLIGETLQRQFGMSGRKARELPKIEIGDTMFYLDMRLNEFREVQDFSNRIPLNKLEEFDNGYLIIFDKASKNIFAGTEEELYKRKDDDLLWVKLPSLEQMDPLRYKWLIEEYRKGTAVAVNSRESKAFREHESNKLERALDNAGLYYKRKEHPPLLEKNKKTKKLKGKKL